MSLQTTQIQSRREFLRGSLRYAFLGALAALAALVSSPRRRTPGEPACLNRSQCNGCSVLDQCGLPAALSAKRAGHGD